MNPWYPDIARRAGHRCEYCHAPEALFNFPFEVEHIIPVSHGGADRDDNCALACRSCNVRKSDRESAIDPVTGEEMRLFHPRTDFWEEHFAFDTVSKQLSGLTPVGRATLTCLTMNSAAQVAARRQWLRLGMYP